MKSTKCTECDGDLDSYPLQLGFTICTDCARIAARIALDAIRERRSKPLPESFERYYEEAQGLS